MMNNLFFMECRRWLWLGMWLTDIYDLLTGSFAKLALRFGLSSLSAFLFIDCTLRVMSKNSATLDLKDSPFVAGSFTLWSPVHSCVNFG